MAFKCFKLLEKILKRIIFCDIGKLHEIPISGSGNSVLGTLCSFIHALSLAALCSYAAMVAGG